jgi:hypothetical protein
MAFPQSLAGLFPVSANLRSRISSIGVDALNARPFAANLGD